MTARKQPQLSGSRRWFGKFVRWLGWVLLALFVWCAIVAGRIVSLGNQDFTGKADVIIVLGAAVRKGEPSPAFAGRIRHGIEMWKKGHAAKILFTGGLTHGGTVPEALVARRMAESEGIPSTAILTETVSTKTWENILEAERLMRVHDLHNAIIVSDPCHLFRAKIMAEDAGMDAVTSPTPYSAFQTWNTKLPFLTNEVRLCHSHWFRGVLGKK